MTDTTPPAPTGQPTNYPSGVYRSKSTPVDERQNQTKSTMTRWPLLLIATPAAVATWSGWVELGRMTGFGEVAPLPGIWDELVINTAITLPIGVEAYAAYAIGAWMSPRRLSRGTRRFAAISGRRCVAE